MKKNSQKISEPVKAKNKKTAGEKVSKILSAVCVLAAIALIAVTALAIIHSGKEKAPDIGSAAPEVITTEPTTAAPTLASADTVKVKGTVYVKQQADVFAKASEDAAVVTTLHVGDEVGLVSANKTWCKVTYDGKVCYILRKFLSAKKPEAAEAVASEAETTTEETTTEETATEAGTTTAAAQSATKRKTVKLDQKHWSVVVVDKNRQLPEGYVPELEYIAGSDHTLDVRVAGKFNEMYDVAYAEGIVLTPYSGYRRYSTQESNYNYLVNQYVGQGYSQQEAEDLAATEILPPGCSEHNLGFAIDIAGTEDSFKDTPEYEWLCENAYKYGFIERYPEGTQEITGVIAEPWHWRYIGRSYAKDMKEKGSKTLEEYLQSYGKKY